MGLTEGLNAVKIHIAFKHKHCVSNFSGRHSYPFYFKVMGNYTQFKHDLRSETETKLRDNNNMICISFCIKQGNDHRTGLPGL